VRTKIGLVRLDDLTAFPARANRALAPEMGAAGTDIDGHIEHTSPHHLFLDVAFPADYYVLGDKNLEI
jgi:hypothetical protein